MKRNRLLISVMTLLAMCSGFGFYLRSSHPSDQKPPGENEGSAEASLNRVNRKFKAVKNAKTENDLKISTRELIDDLFSSKGLVPASNDNAFQGVDPAGIDEIKNRLVRAEVDYRKGRKEGIKEERVVRVVNGLAKKFGAPEYAKTDLYEVRKLRASMLFLMPDVITTEPMEKLKKAKESNKPKSLISPTMSPLEAVNVLALLIDQKLSNDEFQLTKEERKGLGPEKRTLKDQKSTEPRLLPQTERQKEMSQVVLSAVSQTGVMNGLKLAHNVLDVLGVER